MKILFCLLMVGVNSYLYLEVFPVSMDVEVVGLYADSRKAKQVKSTAAAKDSPKSEAQKNSPQTNTNG